jgi:hypothetical protein
MPQDFTVSSTGFVNYFPSSERTAREVKAAYERNGEDIVLIDGDDDWYADEIFHVLTVLDHAGIKAVDRFHTGISGISKSGAVIKKADLPKFIGFIEKNGPYYEEPKGGVRSSLKYYDKEAGKWVVLVRKGWE